MRFKFRLRRPRPDDYPDHDWLENDARFLRACWTLPKIKRMLRQYWETGSTNRKDYTWDFKD